MTGSNKAVPQIKLFKKLFNVNVGRDLFIILAISYFIAFFIIIVTLQQNLPRNLFRIRDFKVNEPAPEDFFVKRDISYIDKAATLERKAASAKLVYPVFNHNSEIKNKAVNKLEHFFEIMSEGYKADSSLKTIHATLQYNFPDIISLLGENIIAAVLNLFPAAEQEKVFEPVRILLNDLQDKGFFGDLDGLKEKYADIFVAGKVEIMRDKYVFDRISVNSIIDSSNLQEWIDDRTKTMPLNEENKSLVRLFIQTFAMENCFYNSEETHLRQDREIELVQPVIKQLTKGKPVVLKGEIVSEEAMSMIEAHGESDTSLNINNYFETALYLLIIYALAIFLLNRQRLKMVLKKNQIYLIAGTGLFYLLLSALFSLIPSVSEWIPYAVFIPTSTFSIIITIIISSNVGFAFSLLGALLILIVTNLNVNAFLFAFLSGVAGSFVALKTEKRVDLIRSGVILSGFNFFILSTIGFINNFQIQELFTALFWSIIHGFLCGVLSIGFLPVFEHILNSATRFRLMELSDLNSPIFKKMITLAPGTYNHSVFIANLAESVCMEIGANSLLARVGAYYHDVGKIDQADYFIENQQAANKHDELRPMLSAAIIKSHVKIGIEKARELGLPDEVVDIIGQHHGKGLIAYFYQRALSENNDVMLPVSEFSYNTERPKTKEAAIVMLADVIEAASRTLRKPNFNKLEKFISDMIMDRFHSGELSESNLTLNDLEIIKNKFVQLMAGHFHSRIEYPKIKEVNK